MQVFKCFFSIVRSNIGMILMYVVITLSISGILANVAPQQQATAYAQTRLAVTVVDRDGSEASQALEDFLYARQKPCPLEDDETVLQDALYRRATWYVLYIPKGYGAALRRGESPALQAAQVPGSYQGAYIETQVGAFAGALQTYLAAGFEAQEALLAATQDASRETEATLAFGASTGMSPMYYYFLYLCYGLGMVMLFSLAVSLQAMGKQGVLARTNVSALPLRKKNTQTALAAAVMALVCFGFFVAVAIILYRQELFTTGGMLCLLNALVFLLFSTALALLVGQLAKNRMVISAVANVVIMGMCFLGGIYVSPDLFGAGMQTVSKFMPSYWYGNVVRAAATGNFTSANTWQAMGEGFAMQVPFILALVAVALVVSRKKQHIG